MVYAMRFTLYKAASTAIVESKASMAEGARPGFMLFTIVQPDKVQLGSELRLRLLPWYEYLKSMDYIPQ